MSPKIKEIKGKKKQIPFRDYRTLKSFSNIQKAGINIYDDGKREHITKKLKNKGLIKVDKNNIIRLTKKGKQYVN